ncbi:hypothetical protein HYV50_04045 [Candidatus Pacearchaeota archaeon]|nr:hypothetical protein [Candidatus Pacearchaeota archaeon]
MTLVKLFDIGPVIEGKDSENALKLLEININAFMTNPDIKINQVNGPYVTHLPPIKDLPGKERVSHTANIVYQNKIRFFT